MHYEETPHHSPHHSYGAPRKGYRWVTRHHISGDGNEEWITTEEPDYIHIDGTVVAVGVALFILVALLN